MPFGEIISTVFETGGVFAGLFIAIFVYYIYESKNEKENMRKLYQELGNKNESMKEKIGELSDKITRVDVQTDSVDQDIRDLKKMIASIEAIIKERSK